MNFKQTRSYPTRTHWGSFTISPWKTGPPQLVRGGHLRQGHTAQQPILPLPCSPLRARSAGAAGTTGSDPMGRPRYYSPCARMTAGEREHRGQSAYSFQPGNTLPCMRASVTRKPQNDQPFHIGLEVGYYYANLQKPLRRL